MSGKTVVPEGAVEAAAKEFAAIADPLGNWEDQAPAYKAYYRRRVASVLEAAAPFIAAKALEDAAADMPAEAWDEAHFGALGCDSSCCDFMHGAPEKDMNPYRAAAVRGEG